MTGVQTCALPISGIGGLLKRKISGKLIEAFVNQQDFVAESVVVSRDTRLVARVYLDPEAMQKAGLTEEAIAALPERIRKAVNREMPVYSRLTEVEPNPSPFEKTPKMSIKRFLYR